jgi:hypothetical protein
MAKAVAAISRTAGGLLGQELEFAGTHHVEAATDGLLFAPRVGSVTFAHLFQSIRQVEQFLLDLRVFRLSC